MQNEFSLEENIALARQFVLEHLVGRGITTDFTIHQPDKEDGNRIMREDGKSLFDAVPTTD